MQSMRNDASRLCLSSCLPFSDPHAPAAPARPKPPGGTGSAASTSAASTSSKASRASFASTATSSLLPSSQFTNHESLPSLPDSLSNFLSAFPDYPRTALADRLRSLHYPHLSLHVPFDYSGFPLFSPSQPLPQFTIAHHSPSVSQLHSALQSRLASFINVSPDDYDPILTANRSSALRLLADSYPFRTHRRLLTVYDYDSEAVSAMADAASRRGAKILSASFSWPSMRINTAKLRKMIAGNGSRSRSGLFVFPLRSRITGTRYSYLWMRFAKEHGWHVVLDASALGPKDMDTLGLSLFQPDFVLCSYYRVFGRDPSGFACLFAKTGSGALLDAPAVARSAVRIVPAGNSITGFASDTESEILGSGPMVSSEIVELDAAAGAIDVECGSLDHADSMGLALIGSRMRWVVNWLVVALTKLQHPHSQPLVRIYGPKVKFDRGPCVAFNVFDWKGEKVEPSLVQKLADRSNISLGCSFLSNIWFADKYEAEREAVLERRVVEAAAAGGKKKRERVEVGVNVVTVALGFLASFEDAYSLWVFVAKFLDADFVEKERWRYVALNQKMVEV